MNPVPVCTICTRCLRDTTLRHGTFQWAVLWRCATCDVNYYCCDRSCGPKTLLITAFASHDQLVRHHRRNHKKRKVATNIDLVDTNVSDYQPDDAPVENVAPRFSIPTDAFSLFSVHFPTKRFFEAQQNHSFGVAVQGLVARSCYLDARMRDTSNTYIGITDLILFLRTA